MVLSTEVKKPSLTVNTDEKLQTTSKKPLESAHYTWEITHVHYYGKNTYEKLTKFVKEIILPPGKPHLSVIGRVNNCACD